MVLKNDRKNILGSVIGRPTTLEFDMMLTGEHDRSRLKLQLVEVPIEDDLLIAKVKEVHKKNPLYDEQQAIFITRLLQKDVDILSERFTYGVAQCEVLGVLRPKGRLDSNNRAIPPTTHVYKASAQTLSTLYNSTHPSHIHIGEAEKIDESDPTVRVTINGDEVSTVHLAVFGQTGTGKTNTGAVIVEEFLSRDMRTIVFDPHDDYINIDDIEKSFKLLDESKKKITLEKRWRDCGKSCSIIQQLTDQLDLSVSQGTGEPVDKDDLDHSHSPEEMCKRLLRLATVVHCRELHEILSNKCQDILKLPVDFYLKHFTDLFQKEKIAAKYIIFPEIRLYELDKRVDRRFLLSLLEGYLDEEWSVPQRRSLYDLLDRGSVKSALTDLKGKEFIQTLSEYIERHITHKEMRDALVAKFKVLAAVYLSAMHGKGKPVDIDDLIDKICNKEIDDSPTLHIFSLSELSTPLRRTTVAAIMMRIFTNYKSRKYVLSEEKDKTLAHSIRFVIEEARTIIPSYREEQLSASAKFSRFACRTITAEGRKFQLGLILVSQKPNSVDSRTSSQINTFIIHQLKSPDDQDFVREVSEGLSREELSLIKNLGQGKAIVTGIATKTSLISKIRPRYSPEGLPKPTPVSDHTQSIHKAQLELLKYKK